MKSKGYTLTLKIACMLEFLNNKPEYNFYCRRMNKEYHQLNIRRALSTAALLIITLLGELMPMPDVMASQVTIVYPDTLNIPQNRYVLFHAMRPARKTVGVALSGGGANGLAQIGVLKAFHEAGIPVDCIAGTSMGAIIGGLYSCGYTPAELEKMAQTIPWSSFISLNSDYSRSNIFLEQQRIRDRASIAIRLKNLKLILPKSLNSAQKMTGTLDLLVLNAPYHTAADFSTLPVNFRAVTTDLVSGKRITLDAGSLSEAMRASSTVPILSEPVVQDEYHLVDGGLVANLPVDELTTFKADYKIAVDTHGSMYASGEELDLPWKAADQAMGILTASQYPAQRAQADIVITPDLNNHKATDFSNIGSLIQAGYAKGRILASTITSGIELQPRRGINITRFTKSARYQHENPHLQPIVDYILRNATDLNATLQKLLATDLFTSVYASVESKKKLVLFHLSPLPTLQRVTFSGDASALSSQEITDCFAPVMKPLYTNSSGTAALESCMATYRQKGYSLVALEKSFVKNGVLQLTLSSGKPQDIEIRQNKNITKITPITREIKVDTTKALQLRKAEESVNNLYDTGVFNRVSLSATLPNKADPRTTLHFSLEEKPSSVLRLGLRYDETNNAQILVDVRNENFGGNTSSLGGWVKAGKKSSQANLEFSMPRIGATHVTFANRAFYDQHLFEHEEKSAMLMNYGIQKYGFSQAIGTRIRKNGQFLVDMTLQNTQSYSDGDVAGELNTETRTMLSVGTQFIHDSRDNALIPTSGSYSNLRYTLTTALIDNEERFWQAAGNHEENLRLLHRLTLQFSGLFGVSSQAVPLSEQFFLGGAGTTYSQRFFGMKESTLPCNNMAAAGVQFGYKPSFDILFPATLFLHYNIGNSWNKMEQISTSSLLQGIGTSIIWETPVGPARFAVSKLLPLPEHSEIGEKLSPRFTDTILYFSIGHNF